MPCEFSVEPCAIVGNYVCRKCKTCGHMLTTPTGMSDEVVTTALTSIKANCPHNAEKQPELNTDAAAVSANDPTAGLPNPFAEPKPADGPGAYLKKYLSRIGITATPTCSCNAKARHMDDMGIEWCEQNLDTIVEWLKEEAEKRRLPFFEWPAKMLVQKAIKSAKKARDAQIQALTQPTNS
jgi:hypothetical protein